MFAIRYVASIIFYVASIIAARLSETDARTSKIRSVAYITRRDHIAFRQWHAKAEKFKTGFGRFNAHRPRSWSLPGRL